MGNGEADQIENYTKSQSVKELAKEEPDRDRAASQSLQETHEVKNNLRMSLRGLEREEEWNDEKGEWEVKLKEKPGVEPLINRQGLEDLWTIIEPVVSETAAGSNLSKKDVAREGFQAMKSVIGAILVKHEQYNISDEEDAYLIVQAFNSAMKNNLKKAEGGRLLKHHEESVQRKEFISGKMGGEESGGSRWNPFS